MVETVNIIPMMAGYPLTHVGHWQDLGRFLTDTKNITVVGLSQKNLVFTDRERAYILTKQWYHHPMTIQFVKSPGVTIASAYKLLSPFSDKKLNIIVGSDRKEWAVRLKDSILDGRIPELEQLVFYNETPFIEVDVVCKDTRGQYSGTKMRQAALSGDRRTFDEHIGLTNANLLDKIWSRVQKAIELDLLDIKRN